MQNLATRNIGTRLPGFDGYALHSPGKEISIVNQFELEY